jgi:hypothetical protein
MMRSPTHSDVVTMTKRGGSASIHAVAVQVAFEGKL